MTQRDDMVLTPSLTDAGRVAKGVPERERRTLFGARHADRGLADNRIMALALRASIHVAVLAIVAAAVLRLTTGKTFDQMGQWLNDAVLGDFDEEELAKIRARESITTNPEFARGMALEGTGQHLEPLFEDLRKLRLQELQGLAIAKRRDEFTSNTKGEILLLRGQSILMQALESVGRMVRKY